MTIISQIMKLPRRIEPISGQNFSYVKLDDVLAIFEVDARDHAPARLWPKVFNVKRAHNTWNGEIAFAREPTDDELKAIEVHLRDDHRPAPTAAEFDGPTLTEEVAALRKVVADSGGLAPGVDERSAASTVEPVADDNDHMVKISKLIEDMQSIKDRFGDTCVYIRRGGLSWGAVALNRCDDDKKHGVFELQAQHDRDMLQRLEQIERLKESRNRAETEANRLRAALADPRNERQSGEARS